MNYLKLFFFFLSLNLITINAMAQKLISDPTDKRIQIKPLLSLKLISRNYPDDNSMAMSIIFNENINQNVYKNSPKVEVYLQDDCSFAIYLPSGISKEISSKIGVIKNTSKTKNLIYTGCRSIAETSNNIDNQFKRYGAACLILGKLFYNGKEAGDEPNQVIFTKPEYCSY